MEPDLAVEEHQFHKNLNVDSFQDQPAATIRADSTTLVGAAAKPAFGGLEAWSNISGNSPNHPAIPDAHQPKISQTYHLTARINMLPEEKNNAVMQHKFRVSYVLSMGVPYSSQ